MEILDAYAKIRVVDSFNSTMGVPRWRDTALVAGSTTWIRLIAPPDDWTEKMKKLELDGIGLRRNEGFGQIAFNHPIFNQRQLLTESAIRLNDTMRPMRSHHPDRFMEEWEDELGKLLTQKQGLNAPFQALARWLHTNNDNPLQELIECLTSMADPDKAFFGQPNKDLVNAIGEAEYGKRNKKNPFVEKSKDDIAAIIKALEYLKKEEPKYWRSGIERLAEWIAVASREEKEGGIQ